MALTPLLLTIKITTKKSIMKMHNPPHPGEVLKDMEGAATSPNQCHAVGIASQCLRLLVFTWSQWPLTLGLRMYFYAKYLYASHAEHGTSRKRPVKTVTTILTQGVLLQVNTRFLLFDAIEAAQIEDPRLQRYETISMSHFFS